MPAFSEAECPVIEARRFERRVINGRAVEPHAGRFYPRGFIPGVRDCTADNILPFRVAHLDGASMRVERPKEAE